MVERDSSPFKGSNSPERIIDISPIHPIEQKYIEQFPRQPDLQSLHCVMTFGIIARDCKIPYIANNPEAPTASRYTDEPLQTFGQLLRRLRLAGELKSGQSTAGSEAPVLWTEMHDTMQELLAITPSKPSAGENVLNERISKAIQQNDIFCTYDELNASEPQKTKQTETLRSVSHEIRTASEILVCDKLEAHDIDKLINNSKNLDDQVWADFSDEFYWRGNDPFRSFPNKLRNEILATITLNMRYAHQAIYQKP